VERLFKLSFKRARDARLRVKRTLAMTRTFSTLDCRARALEIKGKLEGVLWLAVFSSTREIRASLEPPEVEAQSRTADSPRHAPGDD
jgi:hypothetical protein